MPSPDSAVPDASVVICTYNRLAMLERAVGSCLAHAAPGGVPFEIVIADNSPTGHARKLAEALAARGEPVRWCPAAPPNISIARNAGLRAARAELVAFMDDDLELEPGWLSHLIGTLQRTGADVALGPVRPRFTVAPPPWDPDGRRFTRVLDAADGTPVIPGAKIAGFVVSTASSIWRRSTCFTDPAPFDPAYGACGGEDLDLFLRLHARGCRVVWCPAAAVWETIPPGRTALRYQLLREFSGGQVWTAIAARHASRSTLRAAGIMLRGAAQAALGAGRLAAALAAPDRRTRIPWGLLQIAAGAGKLTWWNRMPLYHVEKPSSAGSFPA